MFVARQYPARAKSRKLHNTTWENIRFGTWYDHIFVRLQSMLSKPVRSLKTAGFVDSYRLYDLRLRIIYVEKIQCADTKSDTFGVLSDLLQDERGPRLGTRHVKINFYSLFQSSTALSKLNLTIACKW